MLAFYTFQVLGFGFRVSGFGFDLNTKILKLHLKVSALRAHLPQRFLLRRHLPKRLFFIDNLLVQIHFIIEMSWWNGLAPREYEFPFPGSLTSTFFATCHAAFRVYRFAGDSDFTIEDSTSNSGLRVKIHRTSPNVPQQQNPET